MEGTIKIKLVRSPICTPEKHKSIVRSLGLRKLNQVVERPDSPVFRSERFAAARRADAQQEARGPRNGLGDGQDLDARSKGSALHLRL
jgi:large subunit ribosomal protein L30